LTRFQLPAAIELLGDFAMFTGPTTGNAAPLSNRLAWFGRKLLPLGLFLAAGVLLIIVVGLAQRLGWLRAEGGLASAA
jgi:hypothetical protein